MVMNIKIVMILSYGG